MLQRMEHSNKALLAHEFHEASWICDNPVPSGPGGRSAFLWSDAERSEKPKVQLCHPENKPFYHVHSVSQSQSGKGYAYLHVAPGTAEQAQLLQQLDEYAIRQAEQNCLQWFGKALSLEHIQSMYSVILSPNTGGCKLRVDTSACNIWCVQPDGKNFTVGNHTHLRADARILPCITVNGIYFKAREMGLSLTCTEMLIYPETACSMRLPAQLNLKPTCLQVLDLPEHEEGGAEIASVISTATTASHKIIANSQVSPARC